MPRGILDQIDSALTDCTVSPDAMRSVPIDPEINALALSVDGTLQPVALPGDSKGNLHALRTAIGCAFVDVVRLADDVDMWLDDEGVYTQSFNRHATAVAAIFGAIGQPYYGTVVFTGGADDNGDTRPLTPSVIAMLRELFDST